MKNRKKFEGELIKHPRKNMWGEVVVPGRAYNNFKELKRGGAYHPRYKWKQCCAAYRKKIRKMRTAKESRRRNRRK